MGNSKGGGDGTKVSCISPTTLCERTLVFGRVCNNMDADKVAELKKKRTFRKFTFRGIELDALLDLTTEQLMDIARARRRFSRGLLLRRPVKQLKKKLLKAKKECGR